MSADSVNPGNYVARSYGYDSFGSLIAQCETVTIQLDNGKYVSKTLQLDWRENGKDDGQICLIKFDTDGGSAIASQRVEAGALLECPETPTKNYFRFDGWFWNSEKTYAFDFDEPVSWNITLHALWTYTGPKSFTVTFVTNGGNTIAPQKVSYGKLATKPATPTREDYTFIGWYTDADFTTSFDFTTPIIDNITLYAKWLELAPNEYIVTFVANGGTAVESQIVTEKNCATEPNEPTRSGYTFEGWYSDADFTTEYDFTTPVTQNITLYAKWAEIAPETYTVTFESNGGTAVESQIVTEDDCALEPGEPERDGYTFEGWYSDSNLSFAYDFAAPVTGNITLYAKWAEVIETHTVTILGLNGKVLMTRTVTDGDSLGWIEFNDTDGDYVCWGWYSDADYINWVDIYNTPITKDTTFYSKWIIPIRVYFYKNDGTTDFTYWNYEDGNYIWIPDYMFEERTDGFYFLGWATSSDATIPDYYPSDSIENVTESVSLYAVWTNEYYTITLINSYNTGEKMTKRVGRNTKAYLDSVYDWNNPFTSPTGYTRYGFATSASATEWDDDLWGTITIDSDKTYYQLWAIDLRIYSNIYNEIGDAYWDDQWFIYGTAITEPDYTTNPPWYAGDRYTFDGFYTDDTYATVADFSTLSASNIDESIHQIAVYAKWFDKANFNNGISVTLQSLSAPPELSLSLNESTNTFTATSGFTSYVWRIDGSKTTETSSYQYTVNTTTLSAGVHNITVAVRDENGLLYSARAVIKLEKE